jgi:hypothetical protein
VQVSTVHPKLTGNFQILAYYLDKDYFLVLENLKSEVRKAKQNIQLGSDRTGRNSEREKVCIRMDPDHQHCSEW